MAKEYKTTPIPDRMACERATRKWKLMTEEKQNRINGLEKEITELKKSRIYWALFAGFMSTLHIVIFVVWLIYQ